MTRALYDVLSLDDPRWTTLDGGYRVPVDLRPLLRALEQAGDPTEAWARLWEELFHQGDVGVGSYAAVPHLVRMHRARGTADWNTYALVASIELARGRGRNPEVPAWARDAYDAALRGLTDLGLRELPWSRTGRRCARSSDCSPSPTASARVGRSSSSCPRTR